MENYDKSIKVLQSLFGEDMTLVLATSNQDKPNVRFVDTIFYKNSFYIVAHASTNKVKEIMNNKNVSLVYRLHRFYGDAFNIGHPLAPENKEIREILIKEFSGWYFAHNDENDPKMCYIKVKLKKAFTYGNKEGYDIDFEQKTASARPFDFDLIPMP